MTMATGLVLAGLLVTIFVNLITAAFVYGKLTQRVTDADRRVSDVEDDQQRLWAVSNHNSSAIAGIKGRMQGAAN